MTTGVGRAGKGMVSEGTLEGEVVLVVDPFEHLPDGAPTKPCYDHS